MSQLNVNHIYDNNGDAKAILHGSLDTPLGFRNKIINGKMEIAQRGTSFAGFTSGTGFVLDRWALVASGTTVATLAQSTDSPNLTFNYSYRWTVTTADATKASTDVAVIRQNIEGYNVRDLVGQTFVIGFYVRSSKIGTHCVGLRNSGADRCYVAEYTINAANAWEQKIIAIDGGLPSDGTWNFTNGVGLELNFVLNAGSSFTVPSTGSWVSGGYLSSAAQVNVVDTVGNIFAITGVQLEVGEMATPFEHRPFGQELALCQRYYEKSYALDVAPGVGTLFGAVSFRAPTANPYQTVYFAVPKRATPTIIAYNPITGATGTWRDASSGTNVAVTSLTSYTSDKSFVGDVTTSAGNRIDGQWTASAEL